MFVAVDTYSTKSVKCDIIVIIKVTALWPMAKHNATKANGGFGDNTAHIGLLNIALDTRRCEI